MGDRDHFISFATAGFQISRRRSHLFNLFNL
jgi:hypothetical protein